MRPNFYPAKLPEKRRRFNQRVGHIYLAICLSIYPITAFSFVFSRVLPTLYKESRYTLLYLLFFLGWLGLTVLFANRKNNFWVTKVTLISGGLLGVLVPVLDVFMI